MAFFLERKGNSMSKECFKCHRVLPLSEFYKHKQMGDGHLGKCKDCTRKDTNDRRLRLEKDDPEWVEKERERQRLKEYNRYGKYPEKFAAVRAVKDARTDRNTHQHHWSYLKVHWTSVFVLSKEDHHLSHRFMVYDDERRQFRRLDGELLDTRERHEEYLKSIGVEI